MARIAANVGLQLLGLLCGGHIGAAVQVQQLNPEEGALQLKQENNWTVQMQRKRVGAKVFTLYTTQRTWSSAQSACTGLGQVLAVPDSEAENNEVWGMIENAAVGVWIGVYKSGSWKKWGTDPLVYTNWQPNEPNSGTGNIVCVEMYRHTGTWNDRNCGSNWYYVCEAQAATTAAPTASPTTAAPTNSPTASPTTAAPTAAPAAAAQGSGGDVVATGDPHMRNLRGHNFQLLAAVLEIALLQLPRGAPKNGTLLHVVASTKRLGACEHQYIARLAITGRWADDAPGGPRAIEAVGDYARPTHRRHKERLTLGPGIRLTVAHAMTDDGTTYLNFRASGLKKAKVAVGGLLGEDDYSWAMEKPKDCL